MELFSQSDFSAPEIRIIARGLYTVALVDGLHEGEVTFISDLFRDCSPGSASDDLGEGASGMPESPAWLAPLGPPALAALLAKPAHRMLFLKAAYLLAWADGKVSFAERASIDAFASALGVAADALARLEGEVQDHLLLKKSRNDPSAKLTGIERR